MFSGPIVVTYHYNFILYIIIYPHYISTTYGEYPINSPKHWTYDHQSSSFPSRHNWGISEKPYNTTQLVGFLNLEMGEAIPSVYCWPNMKVNVHVSRWENRKASAGDPVTDVASNVAMTVERNALRRWRPTCPATPQWGPLEVPKACNMNRVVVILGLFLDHGVYICLYHGFFLYECIYCIYIYIYTYIMGFDSNRGFHGIWCGTCGIQGISYYIYIVYSIL